MSKYGLSNSSVPTVVTVPLLVVVVFDPLPPLESECSHTCHILYKGIHYIDRLCLPLMVSSHLSKHFDCKMNIPRDIKIEKFKRGTNLFNMEQDT